MFDMKVLILLTLFSLSQAQNCCSRLRFDSTGNLADSGQNHIIGNYIYISDGPDGYWNYEQEEPNQFGNKMKLYYYPPVGVWYFGDDLDTNMGYALNKGDAQCPEGTVFENHSKCRIQNFPPIFVLLRLICLVTLFDRMLEVFQKLHNCE